MCVCMYAYTYTYRYCVCMYTCICTCSGAIPSAHSADDETFPFKLSWLTNGELHKPKRRDAWARCFIRFEADPAQIRTPSGASGASRGGAALGASSGFHLEDSLLYSFIIVVVVVIAVVINIGIVIIIISLSLLPLLLSLLLVLLLSLFDYNYCCFIISSIVLLSLLLLLFLLLYYLITVSLQRYPQLVSMVSFVFEWNIRYFMNYFILSSSSLSSLSLSPSFNPSLFSSLSDIHLHPCYHRLSLIIWMTLSTAKVGH